MRSQAVDLPAVLQSVGPCSQDDAGQVHRVMLAVLKGDAGSVRRVMLAMFTG